MSGRVALLGVLALACGGCSESALVAIGGPAPPAWEAPEDEAGGAPDWASCAGGWSGRYFNLPYDHPDVGDAALGPVEPGAVDWWEEPYLAFERFDPLLEFGGGWRPVDEGMAEDPDWFAVSWSGWVRRDQAGPMHVWFAAKDEAWLLIDGAPVLQASGLEGDGAASAVLDVASGATAIEVRFVHRLPGGAGLAFRLLGDEVEQCAPGEEAS